MPVYFKFGKSQLSRYLMKDYTCTSKPLNPKYFNNNNNGLANSETGSNPLKYFYLNPISHEKYKYKRFRFSFLIKSQGIQKKVSVTRCAWNRENAFAGIGFRNNHRAAEVEILDKLLCTDARIKYVVIYMNGMGRYVQGWTEEKLTSH